MRRKLFTFFAALSAALCVAACALWVRSYLVGDAWSINLPQFGRPLADETLNLVSGRGGLRVSVDSWARWELGTFLPTRTDLHPSPVVHTALQPYYPYALNQATFHGLGCEFSSHREPVSPTSAGSGIVREVNVVMPLGVVALGAAVLPLAWLKRRLTFARRRRTGSCPACGYDLRASPGRCPECGRPAPAGAPPA